MSINENTPAAEAYENWKASHKVNMRVYSDEEMFCVGYNMRNELLEEMAELIEVLVNRLTEAKKTETKKPVTKKGIKNDK